MSGTHFLPSFLNNITPYPSLSLPCPKLSPAHIPVSHNTLQIRQMIVCHTAGIRQRRIQTTTQQSTYTREYFT